MTSASWATAIITSKDSTPEQWQCPHVDRSNAYDDEGAAAIDDYSAAIALPGTARAMAQRLCCREMIIMDLAKLKATDDLPA